MEKISGIVPSSRRVASVDLKSAQPVRPGVPTFGRPQGISSLSDSNKPTTAERAISKQKEMFEKRTQSASQPQLVQDMADKFFMQKRQAAEPVEDFDLNIGWQVPVREINPDFSFIDDTEKVSISTPVLETPVYAQPESVPENEREFTPPGSFLDVVA
jgi:hypothetical protein